MKCRTDECLLLIKFLKSDYSFVYKEFKEMVKTRELRTKAQTLGVKQS